MCKVKYFIYCLTVHSWLFHKVFHLSKCISRNPASIHIPTCVQSFIPIHVWSNGSKYESCHGTPTETGSSSTILSQERTCIKGREALCFLCKTWFMEQRYKIVLCSIKYYNERVIISHIILSWPKRSRMKYKVKETCSLELTKDPFIRFCSMITILLVIFFKI